MHSTLTYLLRNKYVTRVVDYAITQLGLYRTSEER